jgi:hypothetical protein
VAPAQSPHVWPCTVADAQLRSVNGGAESVVSGGYECERERKQCQLYVQHKCKQHQHQHQPMQTAQTQQQHPEDGGRTGRPYLL